MNIKNNDLLKVYNFLNEASFVGAVSRARTKLMKSIGEAIGELQSDEISLAHENHGTLGANGAVEFDKNYPEDRIAFNQAHEELLNEEAVFMETTRDQFSRLKSGLEQYEKELNGQDAQAYDTLLDALEVEGDTDED
jgi:predicted outer membrane protein